MTAKGAVKLPSLRPLEHPNETRARYRDPNKGDYFPLSHRAREAVDRMVDRMEAAYRSATPNSKLKRIPRSRAIQFMLEEYGVITGMIPPP